MTKDEQRCRELLSRNIKRFRTRLSMTQLDLSLELGISAAFLSDIETGKKWVSAQTLAHIAKVLKIEIYELFTPESENEMEAGVSEAVMKYLDDVDDSLIKSIEEAIRPAVKKSVAKMRRFYAR
jgi:transcriptional regulator with XRE-family HTH domain